MDSIQGFKEDISMKNKGNLKMSSEELIAFLEGIVSIKYNGVIIYQKDNFAVDKALKGGII